MGTRYNVLFLLALYLSGCSCTKQFNSNQLLKVYNTILKQEQQNLINNPDFGSNFNDLLQIGEQIHTHVENGMRPPDETLVDTLTMMKSMLAQAQ